MSFLSMSASQLYGNNSFTVGIAGSDITIFDANNNPVDTGCEIISFSVSNEYDSIQPKVIANNGAPKFVDLPNGARGTLTLLRYTGTLEQLFSDVEAAFFTVGTKPPSYSIRQLISNADGSTTTKTYEDCSLRLTREGDYTKDGAVEMTIEFSAARRVVS